MPRFFPAKTRRSPFRPLATLIAIGAAIALNACASSPVALRGTADLATVIARASGEVAVLDTSNKQFTGIIGGLGDLSHASIVYARDGRFAFVFGRDGGLTKIDILSHKIVVRTLQAGNSIGGAISQDGKLVAVANYEPGGVRVFDAETLELVADIPTTIDGGPDRSKVIGLVDAPGNRFVFSLWDTGEIWIADFSAGNTPSVTRYQNIGIQPYDALITPDGRYYIAGLFGEDGMALLDLWHPQSGPQRILDHYGKGEERLPVYKMPHLEGWAIAGKRAFVPAVGRHEVLVIDTETWQEVGRIPVHGQPVFVMAHPDGRHVWVNFSVPDYDTVQIIDTQTLAIDGELKPGTGVLHMEFSPRGDQVWLSVRDDNKVVGYDPYTLKPIAELPLPSPSGIFMSDRAGRIGL
ncbi:cytochrome D1 domain-containing protein [Thalassospira profundimaris]|uniref:cytochrome D1 domain-containing protein n=1 Tax=Thalassospira profundimaris TaxID=502049 RepID=UPI000DEDA989|nr:cytochrome D1 domain-containing protein [Thalassospira profundimaris]